MKTISCFILFFTVSVGYPQHKISRLDSLKQLLPKVNGLQKLQVLSDISEVYVLQNDFQSFVSNQAKLGKELDKNYKNSEEVREVYYCNQAYYYYTMGEFKKPIIYYEKLLAVPSDTDRSLQLKVMACTNLSEIFRGLQQYQEALEYLQRAQKLISKRKTDLYTKLIIILNQASIYKDLNDLAKGSIPKDEKIYFKKAYDGYMTVYNILKDLKLTPNADGLRLIQTYDITASGLYFCKKRKEAEILFNYGESFLLKYHLYGLYYNFKTVEFNTKIEDDNITLSDCELLLKDIDRTIDMEIPEQNSNFYFELYRRKAELLYRFERYQESKVFFEKAEKLLVLNPNNLFTMNTYQIMGNLYEKLGSLDKSVVYKNKAQNIATELLDSNSLEDEKKTQALLEIERMKQAKALEFEKIKSERNRNYAIMLLLGFVLAVVVVILMFIFNKNLKTRQKLLASEVQYNKEIAEKLELDNIYQLKNDLVAKKAQHASNMEIARNLHDDMASGLAALNFLIADKLKSSKNDEEEKRIYTVKEEVNSLYENFRKYIHNLYSTGNKEFSLSKNFLSNITSKYDHLKTEISVDFKSIDEKLSINQQNQLLRIFSEALTNIYKYSKGTLAKLDVQFDSNSCHFRVEDNGVGFNPDVKYGIGLENMKERAQNLGGVLHIESMLNKGTVITGSFPIS